jgi:asparagine synthetase B (glutamine-hydrolysing)
VIRTKKERLTARRLVDNMAIDMTELKTRSPKRDRQIVGFSLSPPLAREVKQEAARRGLSLRKLFEELWELYKRSGQKKAG